MSSIDSQETVHVRSDSSDRPGGALTPSPPASTSSSSEDPTKGNDLSLSASYHATSPRANLLVLSVSVVFWHVVSANCHERMFVHGLSLPYFITTIEFAFNALVALAERVRMRRRLSAGFVKEHFFVALAMCVGHGASNAAFSMLNYTTQTLFKSSKVVAVMLGEWVLNGRRMSVREAGAAVLLCSGLCTFALADKASSPNFSLIGVGCTVVNLTGSSLVANLQQKALQGSEKKRSSAAEQEDLVFWQYLIAACICLIVCIVTGELSSGMLFLSHAPWFARANLLGYLFGGYAGLQPLLRIFQEYDATRGHVVTSLRKVITFASSFIVFPKPLTVFHLIGALASALGALMLQRLRDQKPALPVSIAQLKRGVPRRPSFVTAG